MHRCIVSTEQINNMTLDSETTAKKFVSSSPIYLQYINDNIVIVNLGIIDIVTLEKLRNHLIHNA